MGESRKHTCVICAFSFIAGLGDQLMISCPRCHNKYPNDKILYELTTQASIDKLVERGLKNGPEVIVTEDDGYCD